MRLQAAVEPRSCHVAVQYGEAAVMWQSAGAFAAQHSLRVRSVLA